MQFVLQSLHIVVSAAIGTVAALYIGRKWVRTQVVAEVAKAMTLREISRAMSTPLPKRERN